MKKILFIIATIVSFSVNAQMDDNSSNASATGLYSVAMGRETTASGDFSTAMGEGTIASGHNSTVMGDYAEASGDASTAMGQGTIASGYDSTAMGFQTTASGEFSTAMGRDTSASVWVSTAMGGYTEASGFFSTAMGAFTKASDCNSLVLGRFNLASSTVTSSANQFSLDNTAFVIGNGTDSNSRSDALVVKFNGDATLAGSMTATTFIGDGSQLTNLTFSYNSNEAGGIEVANYTIASGSNAFAVGNDNSASGSSSTAMGRGTIASGNDSTAIGANTEASGNNSTAMGENTEARGIISTALGFGTEASGIVSTAMGYSTEASGNYSTSMGINTVASGRHSTSIGAATKASDRSSLVIGEYNLSGSTVTSSSTEFKTNNTAFVIGNGTDSNSRSDALVVKFNGDATLAGNLNINSDARLKANIISLGSTLSKLLQIDGKSYTMKKDESEKQKIGLLAQDIEKVFPELVSESHGIKSVNYQGLVPVLINALKEQDTMMKEQQSEIDELKAMLKTLIEKSLN